MEYAATHIIKDKLLAGLDHEHNVVDIEIVNRVLNVLETTSVTKEALEITRLGKIVNDLRRKTTDRALALRAKELVKKWRNALLPEHNLEKHTHEAIHSENRKRKRAFDSHNSAEKYPKYEGQVMIRNICNYEQTSNSQLSFKSSSSPSIDNYDSDLSQKSMANEIATIKYSTGLPTIFLSSFSKVSPQSCSPDEEDQRSSPSSNSCSPPLILKRTSYPNSYPPKVICSTIPKSCSKISHSYTKQSYGSSKKIDKRQLSLSGCMKYKDEVEEMAAEIVSDNTASEEGKLRLPGKNKYQEPILDNHTKGVNEISFVDQSTQPEILFTGDTVEVSYDAVPSSPIRLRSHAKVHTNEDILKKKIQRASRVGNASKIKTTEEIIQDMTMARRPTLDKSKIELSSSSPSNSNSNCSVALEATQIILTPLKEEVSLQSVEGKTPDTVSNFHKIDSGSSENLIKEDAEDILARLPYIDTCKVLEEMEAELENETSKNCSRKEQLTSHQCLELSTDILDQHIEGITGNYSFDNKFKPWNEILSRTSYNNNLLHILPYTVIE